MSMVMSRISFRVSTAEVSGSMAMAATASSGSPVSAASTPSCCTVMLLWFMAASGPGSRPTCDRVQAQAVGEHGHLHAGSPGAGW